MSQLLSAKEALISGFDIHRNRFEKHRIARMCRSQNSLAERHLAAFGCIWHAVRDWLTACHEIAFLVL